MPGNSLGTSNGTLIAQRTLETLLAEFPVLRLISTDYSAEGVLYNQEIKVQMPSAMTAGNYSTSTGYSPSDVAQTEVALTINHHPYVTYGFNDQERSSTQTELIERFARNAAHAVGSDMMASLMALVVAAKFTNYTTVGATYMTSSNIVTLGQKLNGRSIPSIGRFAVVNDGYYSGLCRDSVIVANPGSPSDAVRSGVIGNVHGFKILEYSALPANSENLGGFAGVPEGLLIACRVPKEPKNPGEIPGVIETVTEPNTGLSIQVRSWYDMMLGREYRTYTLMYGVAAGNAACIERFLTVAP